MQPETLSRALVQLARAPVRTSRRGGRSRSSTAIGWWISPGDGDNYDALEAVVAAL
jgi:hypothetical protein